MTTAFIDIDTQFDFMDPAGALYVPGAENIIPQLHSLLSHARSQGYPIIASVDAHGPDDAEFAEFPPHCLAGTPGQAKIPATHLEAAVVIPQAGPFPELQGAREIVLEKTEFNLFGNPHAERALQSLGITDCVVFGVATDYCVRAAALSLKERGYGVTVVKDAVKPVTPEGGDEAEIAFEQAGIHWLSTAEILRGKR
ncbi:MAG: cysteine hydrolase family protein [Candidatus Sericytochromatia bacterium]